jgi:hypothetical protein
MVHGAVVVPTDEDGVAERGLTGITASALMYMAWMPLSRHSFSDTMRSLGEAS